MDDTPKIYTISQLNHLVQKSLEQNFSGIWIEGEVSNFRGASGSGHCYFCMKDEQSQVDVVAFRGVMSSLKFQLQEGLKILVFGRVSLYTQRGRFQVVANSIEPRGAGALQLAFEQLKKKLEKEGLFDPARKKSIPSLPQKIGVVTSPTGAALKDILSIIDRRFANVEILIYPVKVQGQGAKEEIAEAIGYLNQNHPGLDVLLVGRGGGSIEDLWAFNEELVARAIAASKIPIISCVGHEIDFTIADFVSDLRAPTPSAAAELVVKNKSEVQATLQGYFIRLQKDIQSRLGFFSEQIKGLARSACLSRPLELYHHRCQQIDELAERVKRCLQANVERRRHQLNLLKSKIGLLSPESFLRERTEFLRAQRDQLFKGVTQKLNAGRDELRVSAGKLEALSPLAVLSRGYAIAWCLPDNKILKSALQVAANDAIRIKLHQGEIQATVRQTSVEVKKDEKRELGI